MIETGSENPFLVVPTEERVLIEYWFVVIQIEYVFAAILGNEGISTDLILSH